jgi:hypothetical protein
MTDVPYPQYWHMEGISKLRRAVMTYDGPTLPDQYDAEQIIEYMGGQEAIFKAMSDYQQVLERMDHEQDVLVRKYPNKWVVMGQEGFLVATDTLIEARKFAEENGLKNPDILFRYLDPDPPALIL